MISRATALALAVLVLLASATPAAALRCAASRPLADHAAGKRGPGTAIFAGVAGPADERGVPVTVERWFAGAGAGPVVWLVAEGFEGLWVPPLPAPGTSWLWVGKVDPAGFIVLQPCLPAAELNTPDGQALLAEAIRTFGPGRASAPPERLPVPGETWPLFVVPPLVAALIFGLVALLARGRGAAPPKLRR